jgi:hypothetical protein
MVTSTGAGNGMHEMYRISEDTLENVLDYNFNSMLGTYDAHHDNRVNEPFELYPRINDYDADGVNDISFNGKIVLIQGQTENGDWFDSESIHGKTIHYSIDNPYKKIPVELVFLYNPKTKHFCQKENYIERYGIKDPF